MKTSFEIRENEFWWGGSVSDGIEMPFSRETTGFSRDFRVETSNQTMPLYVSSQGRYIWSETPFAVTIDGGRFTFEGDEFELVEAGSTLRDAYLAASKAHFPFSGKLPPVEFFSTAQYNTWMEFTYEPNQAGVLQYAHAIVDNGFTPGIFIIDEGWHRPYGDWTFDPVKFPQPKAMVDELHALGFKVMLWVVPYVTASGVRFVRGTSPELNPGRGDKLFMRNEDGDITVVRWWNGFGAILDLSNPVDAEYLDNQLQALIHDFGVDGFKFDGGTLHSYTNTTDVNGTHCGTADGTYSAAEKNIAWNQFGMRYAYHEYKDTFKGGGAPVVQRLSDRRHRWNSEGIASILPDSLAQGLIGHPFICPDMIGGGEWSYNARPGFHLDEELFIRMAQVSIFFPMMQFSLAPWRVLSPEGLAAVRRCAELHAQFAPELLQILRQSAQTGEPVVRTLEYAYPHCGYERIHDEFMCGDDILVCPVVTKGTREKELIFPAGRWADAAGNIYTEGRHVVATPVEQLAWFRRIS